MTCSQHVRSAEESRPHERRGAGAAALLIGFVSACRLGDLISPAPPLAQLAVSPTNVVDSASAGSVVAHTANLTVANAGPGSLSWVVRAAQRSAWLALGSTRGTAPDTVTVTLSPAGLPVGTYTDTLIVTSDLAATPVRVPVQFAIVPSGTATQLAFTVQPSSTPAGAVITPAVQVTALDAQGRAAVAFAGTVTVAMGQHSGQVSLSGTTTVVAVNGVATFETSASTGRGPATPLRPHRRVSRERRAPPLP